MRVLVLHQNFPGQFGHVVQAWSARPQWSVRALARETAPGLPGFAQLHRYPLARSASPQQHPYLRSMETAVLHGQAVARALLQMRKAGYSPQVVLAHPAWGESLYVKDVYPDAQLIHFCEWYYSGQGADLGFDPEFPGSIDDQLRVRTWNALHALNLTQCDGAVTPTQWQWSNHPALFRPRMTVQHEGIATGELGPDPSVAVTTPSGVTLRCGDPVITYVARNLEPYRGFHVFMRALQRIQQRHPSAHALIVGGDDISYGKRPADASSWREHMLREVPLDPQRTHFLGRVSRAHFVRILQVSAAHVYLTVPFVLSWSLLEAMACGALVVGSDTPPVREVLRHGENGLLVNFFDPHEVATTVCQVLGGGPDVLELRRRARQDVQRYSRENGLAGYDTLLQRAAAPATVTSQG